MTSKFLWLSVLSLFISPLNTLTFSPEKILEIFFKDLFEDTTAGYVIYGQKPVDLEGFQIREKTIPGTKERYASVQGLLALKYWKEISPNIKNQNYILIDFPTPTGYEITLINRQAFFNVVKANSLLFEYKFGIKITPDVLLDDLIQKGFCSLFKENIALQGIVLGYGVENAICYECGSSFLKQLVPKGLPPYRLPSSPKNPEELAKKIKDKNWAKGIEDLTYYKASEINDRLKIPFSFLKNSKKTKDLLNSYRKYQDNIDIILSKKKFLAEILYRLGTKLSPSLTQKITSDQLCDFFSESERSNLSYYVARTILNTFPGEISPSFMKGMSAAENETENAIEISDIQFLDLLWKRDHSIIQPTVNFFTKIHNQKDFHCLIPQKLYIRTLKKSNSSNTLTKYNEEIKIHYLLKNSEDKLLTGSYHMQDPPVLHLSNMIPGLAHGLLGMREGEIREIFIHPDFVYGTSSDFGNGQVITAIVELVHLGKIEKESTFPVLKPIDVINYAPEIVSCSQFAELQNKHAYACGFRSWKFYKKAVPLISFHTVMNEISNGGKMSLSSAESDLLLKLEWLLFQMI